jgi:hypothetical protein
MALDRTWYNTLVDDSGSGLDGSVWDKADVDALMDAIDAELARLGGRTVWTPGACAENGTPFPVSSSVCSFHKVNDAVHYAFFLNADVTLSTPAILLAMIPGLVPVNPTNEEALVRYVAATAEPAYCRTRNESWLEIRRLSNAAFPTGSSFFIGQGFFYWR